MECNIEVSNAHEIREPEIQSLYEMLCQVPDYRAKRGRRYEAATVLVIVLLAKLAGERTVSGIAQWARLRESWLREVLGLQRLPCANTYHYICAHLDMGELNSQVQAWLAQLRPAQPPDTVRQWAIDGKVLRGNHRFTPTPQSGQEMLGVYDVESGALQHCQAIAGKGYEAATAYTFVTQTDCSNIVITADALHTRPKFCRRGTPWVPTPAGSLRPASQT